jgi:glyoxylase-like metal-dependent hydrolase (beta-lactamase superfamily II)
MDRIAPGVYQVTKGVNAFIVDGDAGVTLIDSGLPKRHSAIIDGLKAMGRSIEDVVSIVLTHSHVDHAGGAAALKEASNAVVIASAIDTPAIQGETKPPPPPVLDRLPFLKPLFRLLPDARPCAVDELLEGSGSVARVPDLSVVETPGHTPGHISLLLDRAGGVLFVGDAALSSKRGAVTRGWMNRSTPTFDASLRLLSELNFSIACFGHSSPIRADAAGAFRTLAAKLH